MRLIDHVGNLSGTGSGVYRHGYRADTPTRSVQRYGIDPGGHLNATWSPWPIPRRVERRRQTQRPFDDLRTRDPLVTPDDQIVSLGRRGKKVDQHRRTRPGVVNHPPKPPRWGSLVAHR